MISIIFFQIQNIENVILLFNFFKNVLSSVFYKIYENHKNVQNIF